MLVVDTTAGELEAAAAELAGASARVDDALTPAALAVTVQPLADVVARSWVGPHAGVLAAATRVETDPLAIVTGGTTVVRSGGASVDDLVLGVEAGGGRRVGDVRATSRRRAHRRHTTRQFPAATHAAQDAVDAGSDALGERVLDQVDQAVSGGAS